MFSFINDSFIHSFLPYIFIPTIYIHFVFSIPSLPPRVLWSHVILWAVQLGIWIMGGSCGCVTDMGILPRGDEVDKHGHPRNFSAETGGQKGYFFFFFWLSLGPGELTIGGFGGDISQACGSIVLVYFCCFTIIANGPFRCQDCPSFDDTLYGQCINGSVFQFEFLLVSNTCSPAFTLF